MSVAGARSPLYRSPTSYCHNSPKKNPARKCGGRPGGIIKFYKTVVEKIDKPLTKTWWKKKTPEETEEKKILKTQSEPAYLEWFSRTTVIN
jgi:hypothetical protein